MATIDARLKIVDFLDDELERLYDADPMKNHETIRALKETKKYICGLMISEPPSLSIDDLEEDLE